MLFPGFEPWSFVIPSGWDWFDELTWVPDNQVSFSYMKLISFTSMKTYFPAYNIMIITAISIVPASEVYPN